MLLELVQQLCTAFPVPDQAGWLYFTPVERLSDDLLPYKHTRAQYNHPCSIWTRATHANFDSTIELAEALAAEFRYRFDKPHGSEAALDWVKRHRSRSASA